MIEILHKRVESKIDFSFIKFFKFLLKSILRHENLSSSYLLTVNCITFFERNEQFLNNQQTLQRLISLEHTTVTLNKRMLAEAGFEYRGCNKICYKCYKC